MYVPEKKPTKVFVVKNVDGAGVCFLLKWYYGDNVDIQEVASSNARDVLLEWLKTEHVSDRKGVWFIGLDCSDIADLCDTPETFVMLRSEPDYALNKAKVAFDECHTLTETMYSQLKGKLKLSDPQRLLIKLLVDSASNARKFSRSANLALLFQALRENTMERFYESFKDGLREFTPDEMSLIKWHRKQITKIIKDFRPHQGAINGYTVVAGFATGYYSDIATYAFNTFDEEVALFVNLKANIVIFRRRNGSDVDVLELANKFCIAKGHPWACVGPLSEDVMSLMKEFKPYDFR